MTRLLHRLLLLIGIVAFVLVGCAHSVPQVATVYWDATSGFTFRPGVRDSANGAAWASYEDKVQTTGWGILSVWTSPRFADGIQMTAAGIVESRLTYQSIFDFFMNQWEAWAFGNDVPARLKAFMQNNMEWTRSMANANNKVSSYWMQVWLLMQQFDGIVKGYNDAIAQAPNSTAQPLSAFQLWLLNSAGDLSDLIGALSSDTPFAGPSSDRERAQFAAMLEHSARARTRSNEPYEGPAWYTECSAIVKVLPDLSDLYVGHNTWRNYCLMNRIYKWYRFNLHHDSVASSILSFSSSPGFLCSKDDFYLMNSGLVSIETTNSIFNKSLYQDYLHPESVLTWIRAVVSNRMSKNGESWTKTFALYNSGSYNNQWMVIDYNKFSPGMPIRPSTLWIIEQIPGFTESADVSSYLYTQGYWSSYNIPFFKWIYNISGYPEMLEKWGDVEYSYEKCARSTIFIRNQKGIRSLEDMKSMMQYNEWQTDPLSRGNPSLSIASRYDLLQTRTVAFGAVDAKITSYVMSAVLESVAISGPTHQNQSPFSWLDPKFANITCHRGQPNTFNFDYMRMSPPM